MSSPGWGGPGPLPCSGVAQGHGEARRSETHLFMYTLIHAVPRAGSARGLSALAFLSPVRSGSTQPPPPNTSLVGSGGRDGHMHTFQEPHGHPLVQATRAHVCVSL